MPNEPKALREIHIIREQIYEETKDMTPEEHTKYVHNCAKQFIKKYNLKIEYANKITSL